MNQNSILNWLFHHMLENKFAGSRREMALQLRVSERTLENALDDEKPAETALLFEQLLAYSLENDLSTTELAISVCAANAGRDRQSNNNAQISFFI